MILLSTHRYQQGIASVAHKSFDKKNIRWNSFLHNPTIRKRNERKVQSAFIDNIWGADLADMQQISKFNEKFRLLLCVIYIYSKYAWVISFKIRYNY